MIAYLLRRLLLIVPTLFGIMLINFIVVQFAPGGPVEQTLAQLKGTSTSATASITGAGSDTIQAVGGGNGTSNYRGARGLDP